MKRLNVSRAARCVKSWNYLQLLAALSALLFISNSSPARAQAPSQDWEKAAGGKMSFDVAIPMGDRDNYSPTGRLFSATNMPLFSYIGFAYKLTASQTRLSLPQLPKWAASDRFDIEARAQANVTKDQMRLMVQSLLADRFKLAVHFETRQIPVYELVRVKADALGPQLRRHSDDPPCPSSDSLSPASGSGLTVAGGFPTRCGNFIPLDPSVPGRQRMGARNLPWALFVQFFPPMGRVADRPLVDHTGLSGTVDFVLEWTPGAPSTADFQPDLSGPTFLEALQDQLGLKLSSEVAPVEILVVDHVEEPSAN